MVAPFQDWKILPHDRLTRISDTILTVAGTIPMPVGQFPRRMTLVRLRDGRLVIFSAIALNEDEMQDVENFGAPSFLVVPGAHHRLDAKPWKLRYPGMEVLAPAGARRDIEDAVVVNATRADWDDPDVQLADVQGTESAEGAMELALVVRAPDGTTLVLNDLVANIQHASGFGGWLLRMMKFAGDAPQIPVPVQMMVRDGKAQLAQQLLRWAQLPGLTRILVSHGAPIERDPAGVLRTLAASLD